ncbi:hypothetical protein U5801_20770 [Lamprobacter modestohalophilus]|uniref:hypothetical protein n=1 Tax=Lamprobacter modestohalophilus TaxID=1064514 RepID=UPI002ADED75B|nr:hypothetical protein [Lamprobacter modestohalophilus]MEA1052219.1 hypothetical protein [Lamprobacter modestohalophilus]
MPEATAVPSATPAKPKPKVKRKRYQSPLLLSLLPQVVLFVSAVVLFWLSQNDMAGTIEYWEYFVAVIAAISLISGWSQSYLSNEVRAWYLIKQVIHWGALFTLLYVANNQGLRGAIDAQQYTTIVIYLIAFTTLLAAIHLDFKLFFFSLFLVFCAYLLAVPADNAVLLYIGETFGIDGAQSKTLSISIGVAVVGFIASTFVLLSMRGALLTKRIGAKRKEAEAA